MDATRYLQDDGTYLVPTAHGTPIRYREHGGVFYHAQTDAILVAVLERLRLARTRIKITYGDPVSRAVWGAPEEGYLNTSMGHIKVPILIARSNSDAGASLLDHCVVRIEHANKRDGGVIWEAITA